MRFLCLAGIGANADTCRKQLLPLVEDLERDGTASIHFIHGTIETIFKIGSFEVYGLPPHFRFLDSIITGHSDQEFHEEFHKRPRYSVTPEQRFRDTLKSLQPASTGRIQAVLDRLYEVLDEEGPFDGIMGNSEGAAIAATFLVDYLRRCVDNNTRSRLRCAVFFSGGPAYMSNGSGIFLNDECGQIITVPTCHIIGYNDPLIESALALHNLCDERTATLVDHGRGHLVPSEPAAWKYIIQGVRGLVARVENA